MSRHIASFLITIGLLFSLQSNAAAQNTPVQLRLTNTMPQRVDYYLVRPAGAAPKFVGSLPPAMMVDVEARPNDLWLFAVERKKFQEYTVRPEVFQHLTLAPAGQQSAAKLATAYQPVIGKPVAAAPPTATLPPAGSPPTATLPPAVPPPTFTPPVAAAAPSPDGAVWTFAQYSAENGAPVANLVFGIPETDAVQFLAVCGPRSIVGLPAATFVADVSTLPSGASVLVDVNGGGLEASIPSVVLRSSSGEGMEGFVADIDINNPFWTALGGSGAMTYSSQGASPRSLPLAGSSAPLRQFLAACRSIAGTAVAGAPGQVPTVVSPPATGNDTCRTMSGVRSENGGQVVVIEFVNRTNETRGVNWVDFDGIPQSYGMLEPGQSIGIETWTTHPWMLTDGPGNCIEMYMPLAAGGIFDITVPSPPGGFGPE